MLQLLINRPVERRRVRTRWGWVVLSLGLMGLAGFFLYPSVESLRESQSVPLSTPREGNNESYLVTHVLLLGMLARPSL